jgi:5-methylcytosine-specific restriction endonuclease McrA
MPDNISANEPTWRSRQRRITIVTVEDLRRWLDPASKPRLYGLSPEDRVYIVAKVALNTDQAIYPCRASEYRDISKGRQYRVKKEIADAVTENLKSSKEREAWRKFQEFLAASKSGTARNIGECLTTEDRKSIERIQSRILSRAGSPSGEGNDNWERVAVKVREEFSCRDESKTTYPTGHFVTWLRTDEIRLALKHGHLVKCHNALISIINVEHNRRWQKLRNHVLLLYGRICMRCGSTTGEMHVDHIKEWSKFPKQRYDIENLQVLCSACHGWKTTQETEMDFRPGTRTKE